MNTTSSMDVMWVQVCVYAITKRLFQKPLRRARIMLCVVFYIFHINMSDDTLHWKKVHNWNIMVKRSNYTQCRLLSEEEGPEVLYHDS